MATTCRRCFALQSLGRRFMHIRRGLLCSNPSSIDSNRDSFSGEINKDFQEFHDSFSGEINKDFQDEKVQDLLRRLTYSRVDVNKVFALRKETLGNPSYKLMSDEELLEAEIQITEKAKQSLKIPILRAERKEIDVVLAVDRNIPGHDASTFVFTDISTTKNDRNRRIVVRESSGLLREATWSERDRMNFIYFPKEGKKYELPAMLQDKHLQTVFRQLRHQDVLDLVSIQCEADSSDYIRVHRRTYEDIDKRKCFHVLRSTRHFAGLVFHLCQTTKVERLLTDMVERGLIDDAADVVKLLYILHPDSKSVEASTQEDIDDKDLLLAYAKDHGPSDILPYLIDDERKEENA